MKIGYIENISGGSVTMGTTVIGIGVKINIDGTDVYSGSGKYILKELTLGSVSFYDETDTLIPNTSPAEKQVIFAIVQTEINTPDVEQVAVNGDSIYTGVSTDGDLLIYDGAAGEYVTITRDELNLGSKHRWSERVSNLGTAQGNSRAYTYQSMDERSNNPMGATANDVGTSTKTLLTLHSGIAQKINTMELRAIVCAIGTDISSMNNPTIRARIWQINPTGWTVLGIFDIPVVPTSLAYVRDWQSGQSCNQVVIALLENVNYTLPDNISYGITLHPRQNDGAMIGSIGGFTLNLEGEI